MTSKTKIIIGISTNCLNLISPKYTVHAGYACFIITMLSSYIEISYFLFIVKQKPYEGMKLEYFDINFDIIEKSNQFDLN